MLTLTVVHAVSATVLVSPLHGNVFTFVKVQLADVDAATVVVLRVKDAVGIVAVAVGLVEAVVATTDRVKVHIGLRARQNGGGGDGSKEAGHDGG